MSSTIFLSSSTVGALTRPEVVVPLDPSLSIPPSTTYPKLSFRLCAFFLLQGKGLRSRDAFDGSGGTSGLSFSAVLGRSRTIGVLGIAESASCSFPPLLTLTNLNSVGVRMGSIGFSATLRPCKSRSSQFTNDIRL